MTQDTEDVVAPTHYCVVCAARWVNHPDGAWSLTTPDCGPCCDNVPMDTAPIVKLLPDGSVSDADYRRVRRAYDAEQRKAQVERYRGILCAHCDEPFESHSSDWTCPRRVAPRFKFPADRQSLSDRIDVLDHFRADVCNAYESDRDEGEIVEELGKLIRGVRAALHQEGIAPGSDPLRFGVETRVNIARSQDTPDSRGDG